MKILVTGSRGFIGIRVVRLALKQGHSVVGTDLAPPDANAPHANDPNYEYVQADLSDFKAVKDMIRKSGCEGVIHLALHTPVGNARTVALHNANVAMSYNVLSACAELGVNRIAQASSVNVLNLWYAKEHHFDYFPVDENHPSNPDEPYGVGKVVSELQADSIVRRYPSVRIASLRPTFVVPDRATGLARSVEVSSVDLWGYVHVDSCADAFILAVTVPNSDGLGWSGHERFFITAPTVATEEKTSQELKNIYWKDVPWRNGKALEGFEAYFDCSRAVKLLGWVYRDDWNWD